MKTKVLQKEEGRKRRKRTAHRLVKRFKSNNQWNSKGVLFEERERERDGWVGTFVGSLHCQSNLVTPVRVS